MSWFDWFTWVSFSRLDPNVTFMLFLLVGTRGHLQGIKEFDPATAERIDRVINKEPVNRATKERVNISSFPHIPHSPSIFLSHPLSFSVYFVCINGHAFSLQFFFSCFFSFSPAQLFARPLSQSSLICTKEWCIWHRSSCCCPLVCLLWWWLTKKSLQRSKRRPSSRLEASLILHDAGRAAMSTPDLPTGSTAAEWVAVFSSRSPRII